MTTSSDTRGPPAPRPDELPFVAPCRQLPATAPFGWLKRGWRDISRAPRQSLAYGVAIVACSYTMAYLAFELGSYVLLLSALSGFVFVGPVLAIGLYEISRQLQRGQPPTLAEGLRATRQHVGNAMIFALVLLVIFLVWARAGSMLHVFFPVEADPEWRDLALFLGIGSAVGSIFAAITFSASAFSLPMIADRKTDPITAVVTSVNAVLRNKPAMAVWVAIIVSAVALGFATAFIGLAVLIPLLGHATWHGYVETIDASAWPAAD